MKKKITQISELTYQIYMDSENYLVNLHQFHHLMQVLNC
jgi:hypothetical protein